MFGFGADKQFGSSGELIPENFMCWTVVSVRGFKHSRETGGGMLDLELTIAPQQPMAGRKLWAFVADPTDDRNSEKWRQMGMGALQAMLEACGVFRHDDPVTYEQFNTTGLPAIAQALEGKMVAIRIGVEKGEGAYQDKNKVKDWLSPNPRSSTNKNFQKLVSEGAKLPETKPLTPSGYAGFGGQSVGAGGQPGGAPMAQPTSPPPGQFIPSGGAPQPAPGATALTPARAPVGAAPSWLQNR